PKIKKMLSNTYSDLIYVPYYKHLIEWAVIILGLLALLFSIICIIVTILNRLWMKKRKHIMLCSQHSLSSLMLTNVLWISYKTLSMVSYAFIKPFLTLNLIYIIITLVNSVFLIIKLKNQYLCKREKWAWIMTIVFAFILCVNILYWEFYY